MLGAIAGDIIGSVFEAIPIKTTFFPLFHDDCRFTDDTVLTVALAESILEGEPYVSLAEALLPALSQGRVWRVVPSLGPVPGRRPVQQLRQRLCDAGLSRRVRLRLARRGARPRPPQRRGDAQPRRGHQGRPGRRRGRLPGPHRPEQGADPRSTSRKPSTTTSTARSTISAPATPSTSPARAPSPRRSSPSSRRRTSRMPSARRSPSAATATPRRASPAASPTPSTAACPSPSPGASTRSSTSPWPSSRAGSWSGSGARRISMEPAVTFEAVTAQDRVVPKPLPRLVRAQDSGGSPLCRNRTVPVSSS